jgi:hypothetical protein
MSIDAKTINDVFLKRLDTNEGMQKVANEGAAFVRDKLREVSFARQILPPMYVSQADLQVSVNHDGVVKIVELEPDSKAMLVNFRGKPTTNYMEGKRIELAFHAISSEEFQKTEEELLAYRMPLTQVIEQNSVLDIQKIEDEAFLNHIDAAITASSNAITGNYDSTTDAVPEKKIRELFDQIDGKQLQTETLLMDNKMFNRLIVNNNTQGTFGDGALKGEIAINGFKYPTLYGRRIIISNKTDLLANTIYSFTAPEFLGEFCILNDTKFDIDKKRNVVTLSAYETIGMVIANIKSAAKLTLS